MDVRRVVAATVLLTALAGCNGDDDSTSTTTIAPAPTTAGPSTSVEGADNTTTDPTTAPSSTPPTVVSTTEPSATTTETVPLTVPSTTSVPLDDLTAEEREIVEAVLEAFRLFNELRLDPTNDELFEAALARRTGSARESGQAAIDEYRELGRKEIPFPGAPAALTPFLDTIVLDGSDAGSVDACWLNSNVLVEIGTGDDGGDRVINDIISAVYRRYFVTLVDGEWLVSSVAGGEVAEGALTCVGP